MKRNIWKTAPYLGLFSLVMIVFAFASLFFSTTLFFIELGIAVAGVVTSVLIYTRFDHMVRNTVKSSVEKSVDKRYLDRFGFPVVAVDNDYLILWYNSAFYKTICDENDVYGYSVLKLLSTHSVEELCSSTGGDVELGEAKYTVYANSVDNGYILYFFDDTYNKALFPCRLIYRGRGAPYERLFYLFQTRADCY